MRRHGHRAKQEPRGTAAGAFGGHVRSAFVLIRPFDAGAQISFDGASAVRVQDALLRCNLWAVERFRAAPYMYGLNFITALKTTRSEARAIIHRRGGSAGRARPSSSPGNSYSVIIHIRSYSVVALRIIIILTHNQFLCRLCRNIYK